MRELTLLAESGQHIALDHYRILRTELVWEGKLSVEPASET